MKLIEEGKYQLLETKKQTRILILNNGKKLKTFAWVNVVNIGEILVSSFKEHETDTILSLGKYQLWEVTGNEPNLVDLIHLELGVGQGKRQGYLLPLGLPDEKDKRNRIIPTKELVKSSKAK